MRVRLARHRELADPSAFASGLHRPLQLARRSLGIAQREMGDRNQLAAAVRAEIDDVPVVGARVGLGHLSFGALDLVEQAERRVEKRRFEALGGDSLHAFLWIHRAKRGVAAVTRFAMANWNLARRAHPGQAGEHPGMDELRGFALDLQILVAAAAVLDPERARLVLLFNVSLPEAG